MRELKRPDGFVARPADLIDAPAIIRVLLAAFPHWPPVETDVSPLQFLQWKMSSPAVEPGQHSLVEYEGETVAVKTHWVARAQLYGTTLVTDEGADFAVSPAFQGRGLSRLLNDFEVQAESPRGTLFFGSGSSDPAIEHMRLDSVDLPLRVWMRPLGARMHLATHLRSGGVKALARATIHAAIRRARQRPISSATPIVPVDRFDGRTDALWAATHDCFDFATIRNAEYLNWRYADPRSGKRTILAQIDADQARAYAVFQPAEGVLQLSDLLVHPDHPQAGIDVLRAGVALARKRRASAIVAWMPPGHRDEPVLAAAGFVATASTALILFKPPLGVSAPDVMAQIARPDLREHLTMGDFDWA